MTTNTLTTTSTVDSLMGAYRSHVLGRTLPAPVAVQFNPLIPEIGVQPDSGPGLRSCLSGLLVWAYTLAEVTAQWWHTPDNRLHLSVTGRTGGGTRMKIFGGAPFAECLGLVTLARDEREGVSLDELYTLLGLLRDDQQQHEREAA